MTPNTIKDPVIGVEMNLYLQTKLKEPSNACTSPHPVFGPEEFEL